MEVSAQLSAGEAFFFVAALVTSVLAIGSAIALALVIRVPLAFAAATLEALVLIAAPILAFLQIRSAAMKFGAEGMIPTFLVPVMLAISALALGITVANALFAAALWRGKPALG